MLTRADKCKNCSHFSANSSNCVDGYFNNNQTKDCLQHCPSNCFPVSPTQSASYVNPGFMDQNVNLNVTRTVQIQHAIKGTVPVATVVLLDGMETSVTKTVRRPVANLFAGVKIDIAHVVVKVAVMEFTALINVQETAICLNVTRVQGNAYMAVRTYPIQEKNVNIVLEVNGERIVVTSVQVTVTKRSVLEITVLVAKDVVVIFKAPTAKLATPVLRAELY